MPELRSAGTQDTEIQQVFYQFLQLKAAVAQYADDFALLGIEFTNHLFIHELR